MILASNFQPIAYRANSLPLWAMDSKSQFEANFVVASNRQHSFRLKITIPLHLFAFLRNQTSQESIPESAAETELITSVIHGRITSSNFHLANSLRFLAFSVSPRPGWCWSLTFSHCVFWKIWYSLFSCGTLTGIACVPSTLEPNLAFSSLSE